MSGTKNEARLMRILETTANNLRATLQNHGTHVGLVVDLHELLSDFVDGDPTPATAEDERAIRDFTVFATFAFANAARSAMECQSHAFPGELRRALECAAHGARCRVDPSAVQAWRDRHKEFDLYVQRRDRTGHEVDSQQLVVLDKTSRQKAIEAFKMHKCRKAVRTLAPSSDVGEEMNDGIAAWYTLLVDLGAHPNPLQVMMSTRAEPVPDSDGPSCNRTC